MLTVNAAGEVSLPAGQRENICTRLNTHRPHKQMVSPRARTHTHSDMLLTHDQVPRVWGPNITHEITSCTYLCKNAHNPVIHMILKPVPHLCTVKHVLPQFVILLPLYCLRSAVYSGPCCSFTPSELSHPHTAVLNPLSLTRTNDEHLRSPQRRYRCFVMSCCHSVIASHRKAIICILKENGHRPKRLHPCTVHTIVSMLYYTKRCYNRLPTSNHWDHTHAAATRIRRSSVDTPLNLNLNLIHSSSLCEESSPLTAAGHSDTPQCWKHTVKENAARSFQSI